MTYSDIDTSNWEYPRITAYNEHLNKSISELETDFGMCPYCGQERALLVEDSHKVLSCLSCLELDNYLISNQLLLDFE